MLRCLVFWSRLNKAIGYTRQHLSSTFIVILVLFSFLSIRMSLTAVLCRGYTHADLGFRGFRYHNTVANDKLIVSYE